MSSKYDVASFKAKRLRKELGVPLNTPVKYARHDRLIPVNADDVKNGKKMDPFGCAKANACRRESGHLAKVATRQTAIVEKDEHGRDRITVYAHTNPGAVKIRKFDEDKEMIVHGFRLLKWPKSWFREYRRRYLDSVALGERKQYKNRPRHRALGIHRIGAV